MYRATCDNTVNSSLTTYKVYLMNVILMGVLVIIVVISIYWLACKNGKRRSQVSNSKYFSKIFKCHFLQLRYSNNIYHQAADTDLGGEENIIIGPCRYSLNIAAARDKTDQEDELDQDVIDNNNNDDEDDATAEQDKMLLSLQDN